RRSRDGAPPRHRPTGSARSVPANRSSRAARRATSRRVAPTPPASARSFVEEALGDRAVRVDAPIAQERPVLPHGLGVRGIALDDQDLFVGAAGLFEDHAEWIADEAAAEELDATVFVVWRPLVPD